MAAINFPTTPTINQFFQAGGRSWVYDGVSWVGLGNDEIVGFVGSRGDLGYTGSTGLRGYTGSFGTTGYTGSFGAQGYTGSAGSYAMPATPGTNFSATNGAHYVIATSGITVTLPAAPVLGDTIYFTSQVTGWTINGGTKYINGMATTLDIDKGGAGILMITFGLRFAQDAATVGWVFV